MLDTLKTVSKLLNQPDLYATIAPFLGPKYTKNTSISIYMGVKKKLTSQQPLTQSDIKSSRKTWNNKNSFPIKPAV